MRSPSSIPPTPHPQPRRGILLNPRDIIPLRSPITHRPPTTSLSLTIPLGTTSLNPTIPQLPMVGTMNLSPITPQLKRTDPQPPTSLKALLCSKRGPMNPKRSNLLPSLRTILTQLSIVVKYPTPTVTTPILKPGVR